MLLFILAGGPLSCLLKRSWARHTLACGCLRFRSPIALQRLQPNGSSPVHERLSVTANARAYGVGGTTCLLGPVEAQGGPRQADLKQAVFGTSFRGVSWCPMTTNL